MRTPEVPRSLPRRVLVANRGEIAVRVARTCRVLGVETVAVHADGDATAPHVLACDRAVAVPSYLDVDAILDAAAVAACDALHPGYGFLSESADFARAVGDAGILFVGPPPAAMEIMGSKTSAREAMAAASVPVVPGTPAGSPAELARLAAELGMPVLVKASGGGGGKGMAVVERVEDVARVAEQAADEARRAFGDPAVYLEKLLVRPRHVEMQVFADRHGHCVSLGERECSIQRRHQKILEESPSPAVDEELRGRLADAAVRAAEAVGYEGAGTVEFLLAPDGSFYFLEMNTRLQVEHPVTECVTGLDLVALQLTVAAGQPLPPAALAARPRGHAVEARVYAEDPAAGHLPQAGTLLVVREPTGPGLRVDSGIAEGREVSVHYDPMLLKLIAHGPDRPTAVARLAEALERTVILGVRTNIDYLQDVLRHPAFAAGELSTGFLEEHFAEWPADEAPPAAALAAAALPARSAAPRLAGGGGAALGFDPWREPTGFRTGAPGEEAP